MRRLFFLATLFLFLGCTSREWNVHKCEVKVEEYLLLLQRVDFSDQRETGSVEKAKDKLIRHSCLIEGIMSGPGVEEEKE